MSKAKPERDLATVLQFSDDDLYHNARGDLSAEQRQRLRQQFINKTLTPLIIVTLAIFVVIVMASIASLWLIASALLMLDIFIMYQMLSQRQFQRQRRDFAWGKVRAVSGRVMRYKTIAKTDYLLFVIDARRYFTIDKDTYNAIRDGASYTLYYVPATERIISAQMIDAGTPLTQAERQQLHADNPAPIQHQLPTFAQDLMRLPPDARIKQAFEVDDDVLALNRAGKLSRRQSLIQGAITITITVLLSFAVVSMLLFMLSSNLNGFNRFLIFSGLTAVTFSIGLLLNTLWRTTLRSIRTGLLTVEGVVQQMTVEDGEGGRDYFIEVGEQKYQVHRQAYFGFVDGDLYRLYVFESRLFLAQRSGRIISAEYIGYDQRYTTDSGARLAQADDASPHDAQADTIQRETSSIRDL